MLSGAVLILALLGLPTGAVAAEEVDPGKEWCDGPARYFLTRSEYRRYRRLTTAADRSEFVAEFWNRLDPDPTTPINENRESFERLCALADERYGEPLSPGWRTDRGRVLILMGIPDSVRRDAGDPSGRDREIWTYHAPAGERAAPVEFVFHRTDDGRFRLDADEDRTERVDPMEYQRTRRRIRQELFLRLYTSSSAELDRLADMMMSRPDQPPWFEADRGIGRAPARSEASFMPPPPAATGPGEVEFRDDTYYFRAADGSVLALLALAVEADRVARGPLPDPGGPPSPVEPYGAVAWVTDEWLEAGAFLEPRVTVVRFQRERSISRRGGTLFGARTYLEPGSYQVRYAVGGPDRLRMRSRRLVVPDLGADVFSVSSVVPADGFGPATTEAPSPFTVGSEEVVPRPGGIFHKGEPLRIYLQAYGAVPDPESGETRIDVEFRFLREFRGRTKRHRRPLSIRGASGASMGLALPIGDWRPGDYRVVVDLHDRVSDARTTAEGTFHVVE